MASRQTIIDNHLAANKKLRAELMIRSDALYLEKQEYERLKYSYEKGSHLDWHIKEGEMLRTQPIPDEPHAEDQRKLDIEYWEMRDLERRYYEFRYCGAESI
jgi:hypothetical protein